MKQLNETQRLELIREAVRYCQRVAAMGMTSPCYAKALREPLYFIWQRRLGSKNRIPQFRSTNAVGLKPGRGQLVFDHAIPFKYMMAEMLKLSDVTPDSVRDVLEKLGTIAWITKDENNRLNAAGLGQSMPADWDHSDPLARYKAVGIELVENTAGLA